MLTRKGLHYYVRKQDAGDTNARRDLFGEHEGSIALGNILKIDLVNEEYQKSLSFLIVSKSGGRKFHLRASTSELYQRWVATLQAALDPQHPSFNPSSRSASRDGHAGRPGSASFPRIPTLLDFRSPPRTDNLANVTLYSSSLGLEVLLESGLPWGVHTVVERQRHRVSCTLGPSRSTASGDLIHLFLEGGATASIPLSRTLLRRPNGSALVSLQGTSMHRAVRLNWEKAELTLDEMAPAAAQQQAQANSNNESAFTKTPSQRQLLAAVVSLGAGALLHLLLSALNLPPSSSTSAGEQEDGRLSNDKTTIMPPLVRSFATCAAIALSTYTYLTHSHNKSKSLHHSAPYKKPQKGASKSHQSQSSSSRMRTLLPNFILTRLPTALSRAIAASEQPQAWRLAFEPANPDEPPQQAGATTAAGHLSSHGAAAAAAAASLAQANGLSGSQQGRMPIENLVPQSPARRLLSGAAAHDGELQVDAIFADVASQEHSLLYHAAMALRHAAQNSPYLSGKSEAYPAASAVESPPNARPSSAASTGDHNDQASPTGGGGNNSPSTRSVSPGSGKPDLHLESMLKAFEVAVVQVLSALGPAMLILVKNDQANLRKVRDAASAAAAASNNGRVSQSIRALLEDELARGMHTTGEVVQPSSSTDTNSSNPVVATVAAAPGGGVSRTNTGDSSASGGGGRMTFPPTQVGHSCMGCTGGATLYDPSAAISLLWLRRTLNFTLIIMENLLHAKSLRDDDATLESVQLLELDEPDHNAPGFADPVCDAVRDGYNQTVRPFHSWLLRKTFDLVSSQVRTHSHHTVSTLTHIPVSTHTHLPSLFLSLSTQVPNMEEGIMCLGPGLGDAEREGKVFADMRMYLEEGKPVAAALDKIFADLKLEDLRQV